VPTVVKPPIGKNPFSSHAPALAEPEPQGALPPNSLQHCCVLLREALSQGDVGSGRGGPTNHNYRRLDVAERWCTQALRLIKETPKDSLQGYEASLESTANSLRELVSQARPYLPEPGAMWEEAPES